MCTYIHIYGYAYMYIYMFKINEAFNLRVLWDMEKVGGEEKWYKYILIKNVELLNKNVKISIL